MVLRGEGYVHAHFQIIQKKSIWIESRYGKTIIIIDLSRGYIGCSFILFSTFWYIEISQIKLSFKNIHTAGP